MTKVELGLSRNGRLLTQHRFEVACECLNSRSFQTAFCLMSAVEIIDSEMLSTGVLVNGSPPLGDHSLGHCCQQLVV